MCNKRSIASGVLAILTALLLVGFMVSLPSMGLDFEDENGFAVFFLAIFGMYGYIVLYVSAIPYVIVALIFGFKMLKGRPQEEQISLNKRLLIATCVLALFIEGGLIYGLMMFQSGFGIIPKVYSVVLMIAYFVTLVAEIATIVRLKKSPQA